MHHSFNPIGGLVQLVNMMTGEVIFGGVGAGLYGLLLYVLLAVFLAGLMVGRTPEYLGKKIETREMLLVVLALLSVPVGILGLGSVAAVVPRACLRYRIRGRTGSRSCSTPIRVRQRTTAPPSAASQRTPRSTTR
jgi:K+-transporting ATPase ATPase A chain